MNRRGTGRTPRHTVALLGIVAMLVVTACGHSSTTTGGAAGTTATSSTTTGGDTDGPGVFGDLGRICGPADGDPVPSDARGVTDTEIRIGVLNDAGNAIFPGLGSNYVKVGKAFADWCNDAGGIGGRRIVIVDRDAKLFDAAAQVVEACESDFMLVGGGTALDQPTIEPREKCGLGAIPALNPSYEDQISKLQAVIGRISDTDSNWGLFRLLRPTYGDAFQRIGILSIDTPDVRNAYEAFARVLESQGLKVTTIQAISQNFDNVRTYIQPLLGKSDALVIALPATEIFQGMRDVGYTPQVIVDQGGAFYSSSAVGYLAAGKVDVPVYTAVGTYPLDLADDNPTAAKLVELDKAATGEVDPADVVPWITWLLFAKSAGACDRLTVECVIDEATSDDAYTAGGLIAPVDLTDPTKVTSCIAISRVTGEGITYDREVTDPDTGVFNCDPANLVPVP